METKLIVIKGFPVPLDRKAKAQAALEGKLPSAQQIADTLVSPVYIKSKTTYRIQVRMVSFPWVLVSKCYLGIRIGT